MADDLIERAARIIANVDGVNRWEAAGEPTRDDIRDEARALADAGLLADPEQRRPVVLLRAEDCDCAPPWCDCEPGPEPVDALDFMRWLHAEAKHQHAELLAQRDSWWDHVGREQSKITAERDALQARVNAAVTVTEEMLSQLVSGPERADAEAIYEALTTDPA